MREYTNQEYRDVLRNTSLNSPLVDEKLAQVYGKIRREEKKKKGRRMKKVFAGVSLMAASFALMIVFCAANPALAAKLPIMGSFFKEVEEKVSYKGDYSSRSEKLIPESGTEEGTEESAEAESPYVQTDNGATISLGEIYCNDMALYIGIQIKTEEPLSKEFIEESMGQWDYSTIGIHSTATADVAESVGLAFSDGLGMPSPYFIEGAFEDDCTFTGIIRIDASEFVEDLTPDYDGEITVENWDEHFRRIGMPDKFQYQLSIDKIFDSYTWTGDYDHPGEHIQIPECIEGNWNFTLDIKKDNSDCIVKEINERDENGFGIAKNTKTPYEIQAEAILPEGESMADYFVAIRDAQGKPLESQGGYAEIYNIYQRDVSKVTVYICDYVTYMDEGKAENWENLPEKAVYAKEITFEE